MQDSAAMKVLQETILADDENLKPIFKYGKDANRNLRSGDLLNKRTFE